jgi:predicted nucleic acid-binding protein
VILIDNNILSTFAKIGRLALLFQVTAEVLYISPNVHDELRQGLQAGHTVLQAVFDLVASGKLQVVSLTEEDRQRMAQIPFTSAKGEADSLAYCMGHQAIFVTNDQRAYKRGMQLGVTCIRLATLLRSLWVSEVLTKEEVRELIDEIERAEGMIVKDRQEILCD